MTPDTLAKTVAYLADRQAILDCLNTYCRAMDRMDRELLRSVYHEDANEDHGLWVGDREYFADQAFGYQEAHMNNSQHIITNHTCELDGDVAHTETYWILAAMNKAEPALTLSGGRYIDRFEKRDGKWAIAKRLLISDWYGQPGRDPLSPEMRALLQSGGKATRDGADPSYMRPLQVRERSNAPAPR
jgi:SnoaL-like domain